MEELTLEQLRARLATVESEKAEAQAKASAAHAEKDAAEARADDIAAQNSAIKAEKEDLLVDFDRVYNDNRRLSSVVNAIEEEKAKTAPVEFEVEGDGTYQFTCPTLTWDDGTVIKVRELANSKSEKDQEKYATICAHLVQRGSGIISRKGGLKL